MATDILLPQIGFSMTEGEVAEWLAKDGDAVNAGQALFLLEADKSANEDTGLPSTASTDDSGTTNSVPVNPSVPPPAEPAPDAPPATAPAPGASATQ